MSFSLKNHLKTILGSNVETDIVDYINSMKHESDLSEFMESIFDRNNQAHQTSYEAICEILFGSKQKNPKLVVIASGSDGHEKQKKKQTKSPQTSSKKKFSNIGEFEETKKKRQGRTECDCEGQEHEFFNNCLNCGRIHCEEEGAGPCFFCQQPIASVRSHDAGKQTKNQQKNQVRKPKQNLVYDDDNDYFKQNDECKSSSAKLVVALDFASRRVIESTAEDAKIKEKLHGDIKKHLENVAKLYKNMQKEAETSMTVESNDLVDLLVKMRHVKPVGEENLENEDNNAHFINYGKVFDEDLVTTTDHGLCISMHQPYASLLVAGVKKHEGRVWKTNHRGRLWIAAAAKEVDEDEVATLETFYRQYYNDKSLKFPRDYPTSCLLGCVVVEDCLDSVTYRKQYPNGESSSPFVLICSNPIILPIFYPIVGQHKIYALDKELHNCAKVSIRHARYGID